ncbi:MAG: nucleoside deaminase [Acidimicrobiia bacterium]|nr:nucleoside deaminase [Acidimicrobiia bacterium]
MNPAAAWDRVEEGWKVAFLQSWKAFSRSSFPVGSALVGGDGVVLASGRNRVFDPAEEGLSGSLLAHAEIDSLSRLSADERHDDVTLFTTLEPCVYCMGAVVVSRVGTVRYAGVDLYGGAAGLPLDLNQQTARYPLRVEGPLAGPYGTWAAVLPLVFLLGADRWRRVVDHVGRADPRLLDTAGRVGELASLLDPKSTSLAAALEEAWPILQ